MLVMVVLGVGAWAAARMTPRQEQGVDWRLAELIPERVGAWVADPQPVAQVLLVPNAAGEAGAAQDASYDDVLMRTYRRADGARVMVAIAYGRRQTQEIKIHRPELCYSAQGFEVRELGSRVVRLSDSVRAESTVLLTQNRARAEVVTYWIRIGERLASGPWDMRWAIFRAGLGGRVPDGVLVRASSLTASPAGTERELAVHQEFLAELYRDVPAATQRFLAGQPGVSL
jgi:EpsI family protein